MGTLAVYPKSRFLHTTSAPSGGEFERRIGRAFVHVCEQTALLVSSLKYYMYVTVSISLVLDGLSTFT
jgi:hypothetical protein